MSRRQPIIGIIQWELHMQLNTLIGLMTLKGMGAFLMVIFIITQRPQTTMATIRRQHGPDSAIGIMTQFIGINT